MLVLASMMTTAGGVVPGEGATAWVQHPMGVLAVLLGVLALVFWASQHTTTRALFRVVPPLVLCYFVPTTLTTFNVIPSTSELYTWVKTFLLPASLFLLILALDVPAILRLGWKPVAMLIAGTVGVVVGGPVALLVGEHLLTGSWALPEDAWKGLAALSGSWIGGGANFVAIGDAVGTSGTTLAMMVVPDVLVASLWTGVLLYVAGYQHAIDRWRGVDASALRQLERRFAAAQGRMVRVPGVAEWMIILALAFVASWISYQGAETLLQRANASLAATAEGLNIQSVPVAQGESPVPIHEDSVKPVHVGRSIQRALEQDPAAIGQVALMDRLWCRVARFIHEVTGAGMWKYLIVTTLGLMASFTPLRRLEGMGASRLGTVMLYVLVACIGATADFKLMAKTPGYIVVGCIWMMVHIVVLLMVAWLIRAPIFLAAVGSQANIGGAASAPIVASAYHPSLAPVGVLLAVAGYVLGTYAGLVCAGLLRYVSGTG